MVLIDGGAGAGKSSLAAELIQCWPGVSRPQLVSLDELYPGWYGLAAASNQVPALICGTGFWRWDWTEQTRGEWRSLDPEQGLIIEGCGAITPASQQLCSLSVWLEAPAGLRRARALGRDGELFAAYWDAWAQQEVEHWRRDQPQRLAHLILRSD